MSRRKQTELRSLSKREAEVLRLIAIGHGNTHIAQTLSLKVKTVETFCLRIKQKLNLNTMSDLRRVAALCLGSQETTLPGQVQIDLATAKPKPASAPAQPLYMDEYE